MCGCVRENGCGRIGAGMCGDTCAYVWGMDVCICVEDDMCVCVSGGDGTGRSRPVPATNFQDGSIELALFPGPHRERGYDLTHAAS